MIRRANNDSVDLFAHLVQHHAIILELRGFGILGESFSGVLGIDVAKGNDVVIG